MFNLQTPGRGGVLALDLSALWPKEYRVFIPTTAAEAQLDTAGMGDFGIKKLSDPANALFMRADHTKVLAPRGGWGSWSFAVPAMQGKHPAGGTGFIPMHSHAQHTDEDYRPINALFQTYGELLPHKTMAAVLATTGHGAHEPVAIMSGGPLVADWLSSKAPRYSRWLFDIVPGGDELDYDRKAGLHTALRVRKWAEPCNKYAVANPLMAIALNFTKSRDGTGLGFAHFVNADAYMSQEADGPLTPATITHEIGFGDVSIRAGAISTRALYHGGNPLRDGPLPFTEEDEPPVQEGIYPYRVWLMWRKPFSRKFLCGKRDGRWDLHVKLPVEETPACNAEKIAVKDSNSAYQRGETATGAVYTAAAYMASGGLVAIVRPGTLLGRLSYRAA